MKIQWRTQKDKRTQYTFVEAYSEGHSVFVMFSPRSVATMDQVKFRRTIKHLKETLELMINEA